MVASETRYRYPGRRHSICTITGLKHIVDALNHSGHQVIEIIMSYG
jgi:hypothetical protein